MAARILLLADTHVGFDLPLTPRVARRRRGHDFLENLHLALEPALRGEVDAVVHAGDLFHRARPHHTLVAQAFEPLRAVADGGVPVFLVPGNHERSRIPHARFAAHPLLHIFDEPRTFRFEAGGVRVALFGFPYERQVVRRRFPELIAATGWQPREADASLLCVHHCFEGATVGPADFTFRRGPDVIRLRDVPAGVTAVLTGHVHRHQVLTHDLAGRPLSSPVIYAGSTERTAFAEMGEAKGTVRLELEGGAASDGGGSRLRWRFDELPTRPMVVAEVRGDGTDAATLGARVRTALAEAHPDAVLRLRVVGRVPHPARPALSAEGIRALAPPTMNVEVVVVDDPRPVSFRGRNRTPDRTRRSPTKDRDRLQGRTPSLFPPQPRS